MKTICSSLILAVIVIFILSGLNYRLILITPDLREFDLVGSATEWVRNIKENRTDIEELQPTTTIKPVAERRAASAPARREVHVDSEPAAPAKIDYDAALMQELEQMTSHL